MPMSPVNTCQHLSPLYIMYSVTFIYRDTLRASCPLSSMMVHLFVRILYLDGTPYLNIIDLDTLTPI